MEFSDLDRTLDDFMGDHGDAVCVFHDDAPGRPCIAYSVFLRREGEGPRGDRIDIRHPSLDGDEVTHVPRSHPPTRTIGELFLQFAQAPAGVTAEEFFRATLDEPSVNQHVVLYRDERHLDRPLTAFVCHVDKWQTALAAFKLAVPNCRAVGIFPRHSVRHAFRSQARIAMERKRTVSG